MNKYIKLLAEHLASQPMEFHDWNADSLLEFLFCCYTEDHPLDNEAIHRCYEKLEPLFEGLPRDASNQLFQNIAAVCIAYEQIAFTEGLRVGAALEREIVSAQQDKH